MDDVNNDDSELSLPKRNLLLYSANESDVKFTFTAKSNLEVFIYAHKRILSIGSCVFDQMFNGLMAKCSDIDSTDIVYITDISKECFKNLLMFVYIGAVELNLSNITEMMYAAHKYQVWKLESMCCDFLYRNMDISNVLDIYESTIMYNNSITKQCLQWIDDLFDDLTKWEGFTSLKKATLMALLKRDTLNIVELNLFKAVYKWAENQCCEASIEPSDTNLRAAADNFTHIRFPTMGFSEFAECVRYGQNILTPEEKVDVWDSISGVKESVRFKRTKRVQSAMSYKAFTFSYVPETYNAASRYTFKFSVNRIVRLMSVAVIRNCFLSIYEKEPGETRFVKGKECVIHTSDSGNGSAAIRYTFVPNVNYALSTVDYSFQCDNQRFQNRFNRSTSFNSYAEMQQYYNRICKLDSWNFSEHDPFIFATPQYSLIRAIVYKTSN